MAFAAVAKGSRADSFAGNELVSANPEFTRDRWDPVPGYADDELGVSDPQHNVAPIEIKEPIKLLPTARELEVRRKLEKETLIAMQKWDGVVLDVRETSFVARLVDVSGNHPDEEIELEKDELSPFDLELLEPGAIFYWTIGYRQLLPMGERVRESRIRFQRLPAWSASEIAAARERADAAARELGW